MIMIINTNTNKRHKVFKQFCFFQSYLLYTIFETESAKAAKCVIQVTRVQSAPRLPESLLLRDRPLEYRKK